MRIALTFHFCWPEVRRGGERYLHELATSLARRGHRVTIVAGAPNSSVRSEDGVRVIRIGRGASPSSARLYGVMLAVLTIGRFDVVHSLGPLDAYVSILAARTRKRRRTVYTSLGIPEREWFDRWAGRREARAHARVVEKIDAYGCLSEYARKRLREDYGREGVLTPGGVNASRFRCVDERDPRPTLLYSGALDEPRKGVATLLEALPLVARKVPDVQLWLSGSGDAGELLSRCSEEARGRTTVLPIGTPDDQPARYSRAWATVLPSTNEAFGLVLIESLSCGTPIVAASHAALPELVEPGVGTLAAPNDVDALADACVRALDLARDVKTRDACRAAGARHDWDSSVTPLTETVYAGRESDTLA